MMWIKKRSSATTSNWCVYCSALTNPETSYLFLNSSAAAVGSNTTLWDSTAPTATEFTLGNSTNINASGEDMIAYLFSSLDGVSKVGSYTGASAAQTIDCGFSNGARFVMIKAASRDGNWTIFDTERGIVSGDDPYLWLNSAAAENSAGARDSVNLHPSGFSLGATGWSDINESGQTYLFYAIA
jgi:hypothetical protein